MSESAAVLTSRLIKASALLADTRILLAAWDPHVGVAENLEQAYRANIFGKSTRARVEAILRIFRQRYFDNPEAGQALVTLTQGGVPAAWVDPLLFFYSVQSDLTLRAIVLEVLFPRRMAGFTDLRVEHVTRALQVWVAEGRTSEAWGDPTVQRVARNALAALRDFGLLQGGVNKSITPIYLPVEAFAFLALDLLGRLGSGERVLQAEEWKLFFLPVEGVERFFLEAHQESLLAYYAAGPVVRLEFSTRRLPEYAHDLVERARTTA